MSSEADFGEQLETHTEEYLVKFEDCVTLLPDLFDQYTAGESTAETVERIETLESDCDDIIHDINSSITNAGPGEMGLLNSRIHFNASALLEFYKNLDTVANLVERIADELVIINPPHDNECFEGLHEMANHAVTAVAELRELVSTFIHNLCDADASDSLIDEIARIREIESVCDDIRNGVIEQAFADDAIEQPLVYREFAILLDELHNTMEDITVQIIVISSNEPGIVTEPEPDDSL